MDVTAVTETVALMASTGTVSGLSEGAASGVVERIRNRVRSLFESDARSADALERAVENPSDESRVRELAAALAWYAQRDEEFAVELAAWAREYGSAEVVTQNVTVGRDVYSAGRDMTVTNRSVDTGGDNGHAKGGPRN